MPDPPLPELPGQLELIRIRKCGLCRQPIAGVHTVNGTIVRTDTGGHQPGCPYAVHTTINTGAGLVIDGEVVADADRDR